LSTKKQTRRDKKGPPGSFFVSFILSFYKKEKRKFEHGEKRPAFLAIPHKKRSDALSRENVNSYFHKIICFSCSKFSFISLQPESPKV